jgi:hypothetical protein
MKPVERECGKLKIDRSDFRFSRKDVRAWTAWGDSALKKHLARLEDMEYLLIHRGGRGQSLVYELVFTPTGNSSKPQLPGLIHVYDLKKSRPEAEKSRFEEEKSPSSHRQVTGVSQGGHAHETRMDTGSDRVFAPEREKRMYRAAANGSSS